MHLAISKTEYTKTHDKIFAIYKTSKLGAIHIVLYSVDELLSPKTSLISVSVDFYLLINLNSF